MDTHSDTAPFLYCFADVRRMTRQEVAALDGPPAYSRPCSPDPDDAKDIDLEEGKHLLAEEDAGASPSSPTTTEPVLKEKLAWHSLLILASSACISLLLLALYAYKGLQPGTDPANALALGFATGAPICTAVHHTLVIVATNLPRTSALPKHMYRRGSYRELAFCIMLWLLVPLLLVYVNATTSPQDEDILYIALLSLMEAIACSIAFVAYEQEGVKRCYREPMRRQRIVSRSDVSIFF